MEELLHGETHWLESSASLPREAIVLGGVANEEEEAELSAINDWIESVGLPRGVIGYDVVDPQTGDQRAVFDLAWPNGLQEELSQRPWFENAAERRDLTNIIC
jgi:hypothetical protein